MHKKDPGCSWGFPKAAVHQLGDRLHGCWERFRHCFKTKTRDGSDYARHYIATRNQPIQAVFQPFQSVFPTGITMSAHDFTFTDINQQPLSLVEFRGHPILIVNTASECGYTPQYASLQKLWERYRARGLIVLGVPSNDFGAQEPGTEAQIQEFCSTRYGVDFPLTAKQKVSGGEAHPFYRWLVEQLGEAGAPRWNFHKYLLDKEGNLVDLWPSRVEPLSKEITQAVEALL